jgi:hypothetical protein
MAFGLSSGAVSAIGAIGGALIGSSSARGAASAQADSSAAAVDEQRRQFDTTQANAAPYLAAGKTALGQLQTENDTPFDASQVQMDPGYEFARKQGQQAIDRQTAAAGGRISGAALKAASEYNNGVATTGYSAAYGRDYQKRTDRLNRLAALAGVGQTAGQQVSSAGSASSSAIGNIATAQGNASGSAQIAQGNIWAGTGNYLAALYGKKA